MAALPWRPVEGVHVHRRGGQGFFESGRHYTPLISLTMSVEDAYFIGSLLQREQRTTHDMAFAPGTRLMNEARDVHMEKLASV